MFGLNSQVGGYDMTQLFSSVQTQTTIVYTDINQSADNYWWLSRLENLRVEFPTYCKMWD